MQMGVINMPYPLRKNIVSNRPGVSGFPLPSCADTRTPQSTGRESLECEHLETEYQPYEPENNAPESLSCADCGADLELEEECI